MEVAQRTEEGGSVDSVHREFEYMQIHLLHKFGRGSLACPKMKFLIFWSLG